MTSNNIPNCLVSHNIISGDITDLFIESIGGGKVFHLGGLAGVPFTGKTGFGAYSGHVSEGGHCFVLQAPHIGVSDHFNF